MLPTENDDDFIKKIKYMYMFFDHNGLKITDANNIQKKLNNLIDKDKIKFDNEDNEDNLIYKLFVNLEKINNKNQVIDTKIYEKLKSIVTKYITDIINNGNNNFNTLIDNINNILKQIKDINCDESPILSKYTEIFSTNSISISYEIFEDSIKNVFTNYCKIIKACNKYTYNKGELNMYALDSDNKFMNKTIENIKICKKQNDIDTKIYEKLENIDKEIKKLEPVITEHERDWTSRADNETDIKRLKKHLKNVIRIFDDNNEPKAVIK